MDKKLTKEDIINVAKCCIADNCVSCPLAGNGNCITDFMKHILEYIKNEPALSANSTSSEVSKDTDNIHLNVALDDYPNEFLTGYIEAFKDNIKRLRGGDNNG